MRARDDFAQAQVRLQAAGCRYRIKEVARSPYAQVYEAHPPRRQRPGLGRPERGRPGGWPIASAHHLGRASGHGPGVDRTRGQKERDRNPFVCFREGGYFGRAFAADQVATTRQLEDFCLYTSASLLAHRQDPGQQVIRRESNSKGFYGVIQMVNDLSQRGIAIATPDLQARLDRLKEATGKLRALPPLPSAHGGYPELAGSAPAVGSPSRVGDGDDRHLRTPWP